MMKIFPNFLAKTALGAVFAVLLFSSAMSQSTAKKREHKSAQKVTQIDIVGLKDLLKPKGKPLLINFWATWCDPCREEFPDLVKIDAAYRGKIDFITVSLDDLADINTSVPKFLGEMKAGMPAYLLKTEDESAAITMVSKDWQGNLPLTVLFDASGQLTYSRGGKIRYETLTSEIDKLIQPARTVR